MTQAIKETNQSKAYRFGMGLENHELNKYIFNFDTGEVVKK